MISRLSKRHADAIRIYAKRKQTPLKLNELYTFGAAKSPDMLLHAAQFLHTELPIRLAHMIYEIEELPYGLAEMPSAQAIRELYFHSFQDMIEAEHPANAEGEKRFAQLLDHIKNRHNNVVPMMAMAIQELKRSTGEENIGDEIRIFLDRFYMSRIGIRMLIGQQITLSTEEEHQKGWVGIICDHTSPADVARDAINEAVQRCRMTYGVSPDVDVLGKIDLRFTYIPSHLHHMIFELVKNSLRATVETHGMKKTLPNVKIIIADGFEDVTLKVEDEGGGIPRSGMERCWTYLYTTARLPENVGGGQANEIPPMAGFGYGLPITRLYARYFGGDLQLISMEGYGTDAYLHLNRLGTHAEALP